MTRWATSSGRCSNARSSIGSRHQVLGVAHAPRLGYGRRREGVVMSDYSSGDFGSGGGDSVTEVTTTSWLQRILQSFVGALIGILMVVGSVILLWWNEGRAVEAIRALDPGARQ